jgi:hypothetical protein
MRVSTMAVPASMAQKKCERKTSIFCSHHSGHPCKSAKAQNDAGHQLASAVGGANCSEHATMPVTEKGTTWF